MLDQGSWCLYSCSIISMMWVGSVFVEFISNANAVFWYYIFAAGNSQAPLKIGLGQSNFYHGGHYTIL